MLALHFVVTLHLVVTFYASCGGVASRGDVEPKIYVTTKYNAMTKNIRHDEIKRHDQKIHDDEVRIRGGGHRVVVKNRGSPNTKKKRKTVLLFDPKLIFVCFTIHSKKHLTQTQTKSDIPKTFMVKNRVKNKFHHFSPVFNCLDVSKMTSSSDVT